MENQHRVSLSQYNNQQLINISKSTGHRVSLSQYNNQQLNNISKSTAHDCKKCKYKQVVLTEKTVNLRI